MNRECGKVKLKNRKSLSVGQKLDIINRLEKGERSKDVCAMFNLTSSTVRTIYLQRDKLREVVQASASGAFLNRVTKSRDRIIEQVEKCLVHWLMTSTSTHLPYSAIQEKALSLFKDLKKKAEEDGHPISADFDFKASHGWYERFKKRANLGLINANTTNKDKTDVIVANFPIELQKIIDEHGYSSKQIFNLSEIGLFWKRMPSCTFISIDEKQSPGYKVSNEKLSIVLGGNLEGDLKLKPLLVYHSETPKPLEGVVKTKLPVLWYSNQNPWVDSQTIMHYLSSYFSPLIEKYCARNKLENKALLILDNSPGYPRNIEDIEPNIQTIFIPLNITHLFQPLDQGITDIFKAYYLEIVMQSIISGLVTKDTNIIELWRNYNIKMAIDHVASAWEKIPQVLMNASWKKITPKMVLNHTDFIEIFENIQIKIVQQFREIGFSDVDKDDVQDLLASHNNEITNEELFQLLQDRPKEQENIPEVKVLDTCTLTKVFNLADEIRNLLDENDPNMERSSRFKRGFDELLSGYFELYKAKKSLIRSEMRTNDEEPQSSASVEPTFVGIKVECDLSHD